MSKIRVNLANPMELLEIPGIDAPAVEAILQHRIAHGPIADSEELAKVLGRRHAPATMLSRIDFAPAEEFATESAGG